MWRIKDWFINLCLNIRLFILIKFNKKRFKVNNDIDKSGKGWKLTFEDEFNESELNRDKWDTYSYNGSRFHEGNIVNDSKDPLTYLSDTNFKFTDSTMIQIASKEDTLVNYTDYDGKNWGDYTIPYKVAQINNSKSFKQKYGYFEIRSKITSEPGSWSAFWLASTDSWPPEIDVYEIYTGYKSIFKNGMKMFNSNFHWIGKKHRQIPKSHRVKNVSSDFHIYAVEWNSKQFKIYYDNLLVRVFSNPEALSFFDYEMFIIINISVEMGKDGGAKYPNFHEVDYVRAYR